MSKIHQFLICVVIGFLFKLILDLKFEFQILEGFFKPLFLLTFFILPFLSIKGIVHDSNKDKNLGIIIQVLGYALGYFLKFLFLQFFT